MNIKPCFLATLAAMAAALPLAAQAAGGALQVGATVLVSCNVSGTALSFGGSIDPLLTPGPVDASASLSVTCTHTTPYTLALNAGLNAGGAASFGSRAMKNGTHSLPYQLYLDAGRGNVWGDSSNGSGVYSGTGTGSAQSVMIYGRLPSLAGVAPGNYSDTVTLTISY